MTTLASLVVPENATRAELEAAMAALQGDIQGIERQLANKDHRDEHGRRMNGVAYHQWRAKAVYARSAKVEEYRALKARLREMNAGSATARGDAVRLLLDTLSQVRAMQRVVEAAAALYDQQGEQVDWAPLGAALDECERMGIIAAMEEG